MRIAIKRGYRWLIIFGVTTFVLFLISCSTEAIQQITPEPSFIPLTVYITSTPTTSSSTGNDEGFPSLPPTPTATPFIYLIQSGDTLLAIAQRFNVTLDELLAANPAIDPNFLIVGEEVIIPTGEGSLAIIPAPTPIPVDLAEPSCYPTADEGLWCLVMAANPHPQTLENVSAQITLVDAAGERVDQQLAIASLNIVPVGEAIPLAVLFPGPVPGISTARVELSTALPLEEDSDRYSQISINIDETEISSSLAEVKGSLTILGDENANPANQVWIVALAIGGDGSPVGIRKWESTAQIAPGDSIAFQIGVYSLGPEIAEVKILGEARP